MMTKQQIRGEIRDKRKAMSENEWREKSHRICQTICQMPVYQQARVIYAYLAKQGEVLLDELIADAVGLYAAFGHFDTKMEEQFLGIRDGQYIGGRLGNYTDDPDKTAVSVNDELARTKAVIEAQTFKDPFDLIPVLMKR